MQQGIASTRVGCCADATCIMAAPRRQDREQCALRAEQIAAVLAALRSGERVDHDEARFCSVTWHCEQGRFVEVEQDRGFVQRSVLDEAEMVGAMQRRPRPFHQLLERLGRQRLVEHLLAEDRDAALRALGELVAAAPLAWATLRACLPEARNVEPVDLGDLDARLEALLVGCDEDGAAAARAFLVSLLRLPVGEVAAAQKAASGRRVGARSS